MERREFLSAVAAAAALSLSGCGDGDIGGRAPTAPAGTRVSVKVAAVPGLSTIGQPTIVDANFAAVRTDATTFLAFARSCPHQGTPIGVDGMTFLCPNHLSRYAPDGSVLAQPVCCGSTSPLFRVATSYDPASDTLTIG